MKKTLFLFLLMAKFTPLFASTDTVRFYFPHDIYKLDKKLKRTLDSCLYNDVINVRHTILIVGYTDYLGSNDYNEKLSNNRAREVQQYLQTMSIPAGNIKLCIGKGEVSRNVTGSNGYATDRRVDVVIDRNIKVTKPIARKAATPPKNIITAVNINELKVGQTIRLQNIYFELGRHMVTQASLPAMEDLYNTLEASPTLKVQIEGHICCLRSGRDALDEDTGEIMLSVNRARHIYDYLVNKGIEKERLAYKGFGKTRPLVSPEKNSQDEDKNRRVEIRIIEK